MSLRKFRTSNYTLSNNWIEKVKNFDVDISDLAPNNKIFVKKLKEYILKFKEESLLSKDVQNLLYKINNDDEFYICFFEELDSTFVEKIFNEIKSQKNHHFSLKIKSLNNEIATCIRYKKNGYLLKEISYKNNSPDITLVKDKETYEIQVKYKESIDDFLDAIEDYIQGMAMLQEYSHLQNKNYYLNINQERLNGKEREESFADVVNFVKNRDICLEGKYITIRNKLKDLSQLEQSQINNSLCNEKLAKDLIEKVLRPLIERLDKQYQNRDINSIFIGCVIWRIPFHSELDFNLIKEIIINELKLPYDLDITLLPNVISDKSLTNFVLKAS